MNSKLVKLIGILKEIEKKTREIYVLFKKKSHEDDHVRFWGELAKDETEHVAFWQKLLKAGENKPVKNPFEDLENTIEETRLLLEKIHRIGIAANDLTGQDRFVKHAMVLEALLLNPAFTILFRSVKTHIKAHTPETTYQDHIQKLIGFARTTLPQEEYLLYSLALESAFRQSSDIADLITRIDGLEALIPICAWCKNVRKENGDWVRVEDYIMGHSQSEFTHGICPSCKEKL